jgi:hypothetical protein
MTRHALLAFVTIACIERAGLAHGAQCEVAELHASDGAAGEHFGEQVAIDGTRALVGVSRLFSGPGSAYVFELTATGWAQAAILQASDRMRDSFFGSSAALAGDLALVGASHDSSAGIGAAGAAYVFVEQGAGWIEVAKLLPPDPFAGKFFGSSVAIEPGRAIVGAYESAGSGSAYVFDRDDQGTTHDPLDDRWILQAKLTHDQPAGFDMFGWSVALRGDTAVVGAPGIDALPFGVNGALFVFERTDATGWVQTARLEGIEHGAIFLSLGRGVDISGDRIVGCALTLGPSSDQGAVYVFERDDPGTPSDPLDDAWTQTAALHAPEPGALDGFGSSVGISGDVIAVGAPSPDLAGARLGHAFVFERLGSGWIETAVLVPVSAELGARFGSSLALAGDRLFVGAPFSDARAPEAGAAHVFEFDAFQGYSDIRNGTGFNDSIYRATNRPILGTDWLASVDLVSGSGADGSLVAVLGGGAAVPGTLTAIGELLCLPPILVLQLGAGAHSIPIPNDCSLVALTLATQAASITAGALRLTNAIDVTLGTF